MNKPLFIVFEGGEASGKSTVSGLMSRVLSNVGIPNIWTREPGGIEESEEIRELILKDRKSPLSGLTEAYLFAASRAAHMEKVVKPALESGKSVIMDRYFYSSLAYQGVGRGVGFDMVYHINEPLIKTGRPDVAFYLNPPFSVRMERLKKRDLAASNRLDKESNHFMRLVDNGYEECKRFEEFVEISANFKPIPTATVCLGTLLRLGLIKQSLANSVCDYLNSLTKNTGGGTYESVC